MTAFHPLHGADRRGLPSETGAAVQEDDQPAPFTAFALPVGTITCSTPQAQSRPHPTRGLTADAVTAGPVVAHVRGSDAVLTVRPVAKAPVLTASAALAAPNVVASLPIPSSLLPTAPTQDQLNNVTFLTGVDATGTVVGFTKSVSGVLTGVGVDGFGGNNGRDFYSWNADNPATYTPYFPFGSRSVVFAGKFAAAGAPSSAVGSAGGAQTYYFDAASNWTAAEQADLRSGLSLWSAVANVSFAQSSTATGASIVFHRNDGAGSDARFSGQNFTFAGSQSLGSRDGAGPVTIELDTTSPAKGGQYGALGDFFTAGGFGIQDVVHEAGHALGLGHGGPYNGTSGTDGFVQSGPNANQLSPYDSLLWTTQSYVQPSDRTAAQYPKYSVSNANWSGGGSQGQSYNITWRPDDILAIQRLYRSNPLSPLSGGQIFGYNTNITGDLKQYFDFSRYDMEVNATLKVVPVVTLYDQGTNNTLDLSGTATNTTINLNPGNFSSFDNATDNIAIAYGTRIDTADGGTGTNAYLVNTDADTINGHGTNNTVVFQVASTAATLKRVSATQVTVTQSGVTDTLNNVQSAQFTDRTIALASLPCFAAGTRIQTDRGEVRVQDLRAGDRVAALRDGRRSLQTIVWIGQRRVDLASHPRPELVRPVRFAPGSLGAGLPFQPLFVSPDHALFVDGALIAARMLVNGVSITVHDMPSVVYFHVELERHAILFANGAAAESFLDTGNRAAFENAGPVVALHPDFARADHPRACAPFATDPAIVQPIWARLAALAGVTAPAGAAANAGLHVILPDGRALLPARVHADGRHVFELQGAHAVRLRSRSLVPAELRPWLDDRRVLGVAVDAVTLWSGSGEMQLVLLDGAAFGAGFHATERDDCRAWRWTDGDAALHLPQGCVRLEISVCAAADHEVAPVRLAG